MGVEGTAEIEAMGNWLEGAITALVQSGTPIHSMVVAGDGAAVSVRLADGREITRKADRQTPAKCREAYTPSRVYLIKSSTGQIKIGIAQNVKKRLQGLQNAHGDPLTLLTDFSGGRNLEQKLHKTLSAYRLKGEWFSPGPWVDALIAGAAAGEKPAQLVRRAKEARDT